jgi:hypothetical protein
MIQIVWMHIRSHSIAAECGRRRRTPHAATASFGCLLFVFLPAAVATTHPFESNVMALRRRWSHRRSKDLEASDGCCERLAALRLDHPRLRFH